MTAGLLADTAPARDGAGWRIELPRSWDFFLPSGGVLQTASLRVAAAELADDGLRLTSASTVFCTPIAAGRLDATATVLRRGGGAAQVRVALRAAGTAEPGLETIATFARDREGPDVTGARFPDVPPPDACPDLRSDTPNPHRRLPFFENFGCRLAYGPQFWQPGWTAGPARYARWFRYLAPPRDAAGRLDRAAHAPIADTMPAALAHAIGPSTYRFFAPSLDLTVHVLDDTDRDWLLVTSYLRRARAGYATAEAEVWDDAGRFLAYASQTMLIRTLAGTPPVGVVAP